VDVQELSSPPDLAPLYAKALRGSLPILGAGGDELPDKELALPDFEVDREDLAEYCHVCGFSVGNRLPVTYPHVLAFPLTMRLMTDGDFPFPLLGLVHIANRIEQERPVEASERLTLKARAESLRPHDKGRQVDLVGEAEVDGETVWRGVSTYLKREGGSSGGSGSSSGSDGGSGGDSKGSSKGEESGPQLRRAAVWKVPGHIGRAYAGVSGDRNPIHLHPLTARLFGFPGAIAHGMWMKARCLAAFEGRLPDRLEAEVAFKRPMVIPARAAFWTAHRDGGYAFELRDARKDSPHVAGHAGPRR